MVHNRSDPEILIPTQVENAASEVVDKESFDIPSVTLLLPPVHGRPHPQSAIEQRLSQMIEADATVCTASRRFLLFCGRFSHRPHLHRLAGEHGPAAPPCRW